MKCQKCGKTLGLFNPGTPIGDGSGVCFKCIKELGFDKEYVKYCTWSEIKHGKAALDKLKSEKSVANYMFLAHSDDPKVDKILEDYQKTFTEDEDKYDGYTVKELKESCDYGTRHYKYPPLEAYAELRDAVLDGKPTYEVYIFDGSKDVCVGYPPKTKVKKIREILDKHPVKVTAEIEGGHYMVLKDNGWVETDYPDQDLKVRVTLDWSDSITFESIGV